jgi:peptide/nickel transport system ATP-binding protein/oligopeptide transport system ATP-binding protein
MLLEVADLHVHFIARDRWGVRRVAKALNGVSLALGEGEILGLVGETGAGKSLTALSIMGMLRPPAEIVAGSIRLDGRELVGIDRSALRLLRGGEMALIVQSPKTALDPLTRVGDQIKRIRRAHRGGSDDDAARRARDMLEAVGIPDAGRRLRAWPHELSGGMAQRIVIAMALINEPRLLIADEPTTGLDVTVQAQILDLLRAEAHRRALGTLLITHDLGVVAQYCDRVAVMYAGALVEYGSVRAVFAAPAHPYTQALIASAPDRILLGQVSGAGAPPDLYNLPSGCVYADRCARVAEQCQTAPPLMVVATGHGARCHFAEPVS